jgi:hypothetical protein
MKPGAQRSKAPGCQHPQYRTPAGVTEAHGWGEFEMTRNLNLLPFRRPFGMVYPEFR